MSERALAESNTRQREGLLSAPILFAYAAMISFGVWGLLVQLASRDLSGAGLKIWAFFGQTLVTLIICAAMRFKVKWHPRGSTFAVLSGLVGGLGDLAFFAGLHHGGPSSTLVPLTATFPVVTAVLAVALLREQLRKRDKAGIALAVIAAVLLSM